MPFHRRGARRRGKPGKTGSGAADACPALACRQFGVFTWAAKKINLSAARSLICREWYSKVAECDPAYKSLEDAWQDKVGHARTCLCTTPATTRAKPIQDGADPRHRLLEEVWLDSVKLARRRYMEKAVISDALGSECRRLRPRVDAVTASAYRRTLELERQALRVYVEALTAYTELVVHGIPPASHLASDYAWTQKDQLSF